LKLGYSANRNVINLSSGKIKDKKRCVCF
jgi:hypothetical protein